MLRDHFVMLLLVLAAIFEQLIILLYSILLYFTLYNTRLFYSTAPSGTYKIKVLLIICVHMLQLIVGMVQKNDFVFQRSYHYLQL